MSIESDADIVAHLQGQLNKLATFIMMEVDGEPSKDEGAIDCAIRIIKTYQGSRSQQKKPFFD